VGYKEERKGKKRREKLFFKAHQREKPERLRISREQEVLS